MTINVTIEVPKGSRNKYELDKNSGNIVLDRVLHSSVHYPACYGFIPDSLYADGDPLDVMVITRFPTVPGCVIPSRPIGVLKMIDTGDADEKIIAVPEKDPYHEKWNNIEDVPAALKNEIEEFFKTYKNLEKGKSVEIKGWGDKDEAEKIINESIQK